MQLGTDIEQGEAGGVQQTYGHVGLLYAVDDQ